MSNLVKLNIKLSKLKNELSTMQKYHSSLWDTYGSELCAGDMSNKEKQLEKKISNIESKIRNITVEKN